MNTESMKVTSINIGNERLIQDGNRMVRTGIYKTPTASTVRVHRLGLQGDLIADAKHHGGPDQAVYIYGAQDYEWWETELGRQIPAGTFGENLTVGGLESPAFRIGDILRVGSVVLQVTSPRIPCSVFAARMQDPHWVKSFRDAARPGLYCRVLEEGVLETGAAVSVEEYRGETLTILEMFLFHYQKEKSADLQRRLLNAPIDLRTRRALEAKPAGTPEL